MKAFPAEGELENWVSPQRLLRYRIDPRDTVSLYLWNARRACSMLEIIQHLEVIIRNLVHAQLRTSRGKEEIPWYLDSEFALSSRTFAELQSAVRRAGGPQAEQGKVVAEISFVTWRFLMSRRYRNLVWARVAPAMQGVPRRERDLTEFNNSLGYLNRIRNRCAHSEPVYDIDPHQFVGHIGYLARHIGPEAEEWLTITWWGRESDSPFLN